MSDYRQQQGVALSWRRAAQVTINNPLAGVPSLGFQEEDVVQANGQTFRTPLGATSALTVPFDPAGSIALVNPETGAPLGATVSHQELYVILYSVYLKAAQDRDIAAEAPPFPVVQE